MPHYPSADAVAIRDHANQMDSQPMVVVPGQVDQQQRIVTDIIDHRLHPPIIPKITHRETSARLRLSDRRTRLLGDVLELTIPLIPIKHSWLSVSRAHIAAVNLGINVAVDH